MRENVVRFRVLDSTGHPVARAAITFVESSAHVPEIALLSNAEGWVDFSLPDGSYVVRAHGPAGRVGRIAFEKLGVESREVTLQLA